MKAFIVAMGLSIAVASAASAQLAPLDGGRAPAPLDGVAVIGTPSAAVSSDDLQTRLRTCEEQARAFRARNTQSPSRRQQALAECLAVEERRQRVEIAGD